MVFSPLRRIADFNTDLLSWTFSGPGCKENKSIYIDALNDTRRLTFVEARCLVRKLVSGLKVHGVKPRDTVLVHSFSDIMYPMLYLGIIGAGSSFIGSNPSSTSTELAHILSLASVRYIITSPEQLSAIVAANNTLTAPIPEKNIFIFNTPHNPSIPSGYESWETLLQHGECAWEQLTDEKSTKEAVSSLFLTSGTTGTFKIAVISHRAMIARCIASHDPYPKSYSVSRLLCLPMFHGVAATATHLDPLRYGIPTYILPRFSTNPFLETMHRYQITETSMVPAILSLIMRSQAEVAHETREKLGSLRLVRCAGAPLDVGVQKKFRERLNKDAIIVRAWGLTEFGTATSFLHRESDDTGSCGRLLANVEARIIDTRGKDINSDDTPGEVLLRGPSTMIGYLGNEEATADTLEDGWLKTGDVAYCSKGKWYLVGRSKEMIKVRGWQIAPAELEQCLMQHPLVMDAAVVGIKSPKEESELPRAYVVLNETPESGTRTAISMEQELKTFLGVRLAKYKALDGGIKFVESLPKTASGKTIKPLLREEASRELAEGKIQLKLH